MLLVDGVNEAARRFAVMKDYIECRLLAKKLDAETVRDALDGHNCAFRAAQLRPGLRPVAAQRFKSWLADVEMVGSSHRLGQQCYYVETTVPLSFARPQVIESTSSCY